MFKPVFTEKSLKMAKQGQYVFWVDLRANKTGLKAELKRIFGVHVVSIKTLKLAGEHGKNIRGKIVNKLATKKAIFTLKEGEKLDVFEESKK